jgi:glutaminyl-peptide cyclotransferase
MTRSTPPIVWFLGAAYVVSCTSPQSKDVQARSVSNSASSSASDAHTIPVVAATVVKTYPHDSKAFTQGLEFYGGYLYESTGRTGQSTLRECALETGAVRRRVDLPADEFGEGLTIFRGKIYQLTWLSKKGFI